MWSYSKLNTYLRCPRFFKETYIDGTKEPSNDRFIVGEAFHYVMEENGKILYTTGHCLPQSEAIKLFTEKSKDFSQLVTTYYNSGKFITPLGLEYIEYPFIIDCYGIPLTGRIDVISDDYTVWDYKTSKTPYSLVDLQESLQLTIYAEAFFAEFKTLPRRVGYQVIMKDYSGVQQITDTRTTTDIEKMKQLVVKCDDEVKTGTFDKRKGTQCSWCFLKDKCWG